MPLLAFSLFSLVGVSTICQCRRRTFRRTAFYVLLVVAPLWGVIADLLSDGHDGGAWHRVRGAHMIMTLKVISLAIDVESTTDAADAAPLSVLGYLLFPGSLIFGPWHDFACYQRIIRRPLHPLYDVWQLLAIVQSVVCASAALLVSTCITSFLLADVALHSWMAALRNALSFRTSHYYVCFVSQALIVTAGCHHSEEASKVTRPQRVELPASLSAVAVNWNLPVHRWLKKYVYVTSRRELGLYGKWPSYLLTYFASALFHVRQLHFRAGIIIIN